MEVLLDIEDCRFSKVKEADKPHSTATMQLRVQDTSQEHLRHPTLITIGQMVHQASKLRVVISVPPPGAKKISFAFTHDYEAVKMSFVALREKILQALDPFDPLELGLWPYGEDDSTTKLIVVIVVKDNIYDEWERSVPKSNSSVLPLGLHSSWLRDNFWMTDAWESRVGPLQGSRQTITCGESAYG